MVDEPPPIAASGTPVGKMGAYPQQERHHRRFDGDELVRHHAVQLAAQPAHVKLNDFRPTCVPGKLRAAEH